MALSVRRLDLPPDPFRLARALAGRPGIALLWAENGKVAFVTADPVTSSNALDPEPELSLAAAGDLGRAPRWIGLVPYETCRTLEPVCRDQRRAPLVVEPLWLRYAAVARVTEHVDVIGESDTAVEALSSALRAKPRASDVDVRLRSAPEPGRLHAARIRTALEHIARGDVYEVNLARRLELSVRGAPWDVLFALGTSGLPPHAFVLECADLAVIGASPELCLRLEPDGSLLTSPIKGTRPRHADPELDRRLAAELDADPKERAELTMIVDVERNDLGRVAVLGSVRVVEAPHVVSLPSVHHRLASIECRILPGLSRKAVFQALLPSGSVTGAPKRRAMQLIAELEPERRGLYTGVMGFLRHDGGVELGMAIRTLVVRAGLGHYFTGGGIVADSDPEREVEETRWKAEGLIALVRSSTAGAENWAD